MDRSHRLTYRIRCHHSHHHRSPCIDVDCMGTYHQHCILLFLTNQRWRRNNQHRNCPQHHLHLCLWLASNSVGSGLHSPKFHRCSTIHPHRNLDIRICRKQNDLCWYHIHRYYPQTHRAHNHHILGQRSRKFLRMLDIHRRVDLLGYHQIHPYQHLPIVHRCSASHRCGQR